MKRCMEFIALILFGIQLILPNAAKCSEQTDGKLDCVVLQNGGKIVQLWAIPNREGLEVQAVADEHLPVMYLHETGLVLNPPQNIKLLSLTIGEIAEQEFLTTIDLSGTDVTDDDIRVISKLSNLEYMVLDRTSITYKCLEHVRTCKNLRLLSFHGCDVTVGAPLGLEYPLPGLVRISGEGHTLIPIRDSD